MVPCISIIWDICTCADPGGETRESEWGALHACTHPQPALWQKPADRWPHATGNPTATIFTIGEW